MKQVKIDLARPFEEIAAKLRSIPPTDNFINRNDTVCEPSSKVEEVLRSIYEAANGRTVATQIGLITIAPPTAAFLKDAPFFVETQADFLLQALVGSTVDPVAGPAFVRAGTREKSPIGTPSSADLPASGGEAFLTQSDKNNYDQPAHSHHYPSPQSKRFSVGLRTRRSCR